MHQEIVAYHAAVDAQDKLLDQRALALTMAIMTQVYVSKARLVHFRKELDTASAYHRTQQELIGYVRSEHASNRVSEQTLLREELNAAVGEVRLNLARAALQNALANLLASLGRDPLPQDAASDASLAEIMGALRSQLPGAVERGKVIQRTASAE